MKPIVATFKYNAEVKKKLLEMMNAADEDTKDVNNEYVYDNAYIYVDDDEIVIE